MSEKKVTSNSHASLPAKPAGPLPPAFKPAFGGNRGHGGSSGGPAQSNYATAGNNAWPRAGVAVSATYQQNYSPTVSAPPAPPSHVSQAQAGYGGYGAGTYQQPYQQPSYSQQTPYYSQPGYAAYPTATSTPQIQNPFPTPTHVSGGAVGNANGNAGFDPEWEAQAAQWSQNYVKQEENAKGGFAKKEQGNANTIPLGQRGGTQLSKEEMASAAASGNTRAAAVVAGADGKEKTVVRSGGGKTWEDPSLLEWDPTHPRLFIGNLAGEVTDDSLFKAFSVYPSVEKARVIRDRRTTKSKGYGFVSFRDSDDYFSAAKEMNNKYIGSHPVQIKRATTDIKAVKVPQKGNKGGKHGFNKNKKSGNGSFGNGGVGSVSGGAGTGAGVKKNRKTTAGGLKILA
jgi:hypothetical protein